MSLAETYRNMLTLYGVPPKQPQPRSRPQPRTRPYLHYQILGGRESEIVIRLNASANVLLLDANNFAAYRSGRAYTYYGGWFTCTPVVRIPPYYDQWHLVIDRGGQPGGVTASVQIHRN